MRVVYYKPMYEKMDEAIVAAAAQGKTIDRIVLTDVEWAEFMNDLNKLNLAPFPGKYTQPHTGIYCGVKVCRERT